MRSIPLAMSLAAATGALGAPSVSIDLTNLRIQHNTNQTRSSSPQTIDTARRYSYRVSDTTMVRGQGGVLGTLYPQPTPIAQVLEDLQPGSSAFLRGASNNPSGTLPSNIAPQTVNAETTLLGIPVTVALTAGAGIDAQGVASFSITNVTVSPSILVGSLLFTQGSAIVTAHCLADYDLDGGVTIDDLLVFLALFEAGSVAADVNADDGVDITDLLGFIEALDAGC